MTDLPVHVVNIQDGRSPSNDETQMEQSEVTRLDTSYVSKKQETHKKNGGYVQLKRKAKTQIQYKNLDESSESEGDSEDDPDFMPDTEGPQKIRTTTTRQSKKQKMKENESEKDQNLLEKAEMEKKEKLVNADEKCTSVKTGRQVEKTENMKTARKVYVPSVSTKCYCQFCQKSLKTLSALKKHLALKHRYISSELYLSKIILKRVIHHSFLRKLVKVEDNPDVQTSPRNEESTRDNQRVYSSEMTKEQRSKGQMKCKVCSKAFSHYSSLVKHVREQHVTVLRMDKNGLYYKLEKHLKMKMKLFETKKGSSDWEQDKRKNQKKRVTVECYLCENKISRGMYFASHLMNVHGHTFEKAREISGYPKRKMTFNEDANSTCPECNLTFEGAKELKGHLKKVHNFDDFSYSCPECHNTYYSLVAIKSHLRWIHGKHFMQIKEIIGQMLHCEAENCEFRTGNMHEMKMHVMKKHPSVRFKCHMCRYICYSRIMLQRHMNIKHFSEEEQMKRQCHICGKRFVQKYSLRNHHYVIHGIKHPNLKLFRCSVKGCGKLLVCTASLKKHEKSHSKERNFECPHCHLKLKTKITLKSHIDTVHLGIRPYLCQFCGQTFGKICSYKTHIKSHHSEEKFQCTECPFATGSKSYFNTHLFHVHKIKAEDDNRKELKCPHCDYTTLIATRYRCHVNTHKNIREYACNICDEKFLTSTTLLTHKQWMHSEITHKCNQCDYQTKTKQKLNQHIKVQHLLKGVKPYKCHYCSFTCATSGNTRKHVQQKHKGLEIKYTRDDSVLEAAKRAQKSGTSVPSSKT